MNDLILSDGWALETNESPEGRYAYSHMVKSCYGAPRTIDELQAAIIESGGEVSELEDLSLRETDEGLIGSYKKKYLFCQGRSFAGGEHINFVKQAAEMKNEAALIDWAKNYLPRHEDANPSTSIKFASYLEESLSEMTYDRALLIGRLYAEGEVNNSAWHKKSFEEMTYLRQSMAYYELARRVAPSDNIPQSTDCEIMEDLLFQLHVGMSTNDVVEIETLSSSLYEKWF